LWLLPVIGLLPASPWAGAQEKATDAEPAVTVLRGMGCEVKTEPSYRGQGVKVLFVCCDSLERALPRLQDVRDLQAVDL
jgi:hypothetical protein